jgi:hypothetical protein
MELNTCPMCFTEIPVKWGRDGITGSGMANRRDGKHDAILTVTCLQCQTKLMTVTPNETCETGPFRWEKDEEAN